MGLLPEIHMPPILFSPKYSERQTEALQALDDPAISELGFGGAKGGGKSIFGCQWMVREAIRLIAKYNLRPSKHPLMIGWMGRKQATDFNKSTLERWKEIIPSDLYEIKTQQGEIVLLGTVKIGYGGLDASTDIQKFNSAQYCRIFLDQAEETTLDDVAALRGTMDRPIANLGTISGKALYTFNPAPGWVWDQFVLNCKPGKRFVKSLVKDNPWIDRVKYEARLRESFGHRPELLAAYLDGVLLDNADNTIIQMGWVRMAQGLRLPTQRPAHFFACDPARFGDCETIIYEFQDTEIIGEEIYGKQDTVHTASKLAIKSKNNKDCFVVVDECGIGGGVFDNLVALQVPVIGLDSAGQAQKPERYVNTRAEMWWQAGERFSRGEVGQHHDDPKLQGQLCSPRYKFVAGGRIQVESKEDIVKRLGVSPDRADTDVMGLYALDVVRDPDRGWGGGIKIRRGVGPKSDVPPEYSQEWLRQVREQQDRTREREEDVY